METPSEPVVVPTAVPPHLGLAIACLVLGILACVFSVLIVGAFLGIVGLILGAVYLGRYKKPRTMAWWGVGLCLAGILGTVAMSVVYLRWLPRLQNGNVASFSKWEGVAAPDIAATSLDGTAFKLNELRGKRVVLDFWATWCGPCVKEIPHFIRLRNETSENDLIIVGISSEDKATLDSFAKQKGMNYLVVAAGALPEPYNDVEAIPTTFFIDRKGVIRTVVVGYHDFDQLKKLASSVDFEGMPKPATKAEGK